jgi:hypothetical protein
MASKMPVKLTSGGDPGDLSALMRSADAGGGIETEHVQDRGRAIKSLKDGRSVYIDGQPSPT